MISSFSRMLELHPLCRCPVHAIIFVAVIALGKRLKQRRQKAGSVMLNETSCKGEPRSKAQAYNEDQTQEPFMKGQFLNIYEVRLVVALCKVSQGKSA